MRDVPRQSCETNGRRAESPDAKLWIKQQVTAECERIKAGNARVVPLPVKNCGILVEHDDIPPSMQGKNASSRKRRVKVVNRIEIGSGMDFTAVSQLMISDPVPYPFRTGYQFVHVLAFTASSNTMALLCPYVYAPYLKKGPMSTDMIDAASRGELVAEEVVAAVKNDKDCFENSLKEWVLINEKLSRARHSIKEFHSIA